MDYATHCEELAREGERFVARARDADGAAPVPSCPQWCVSDLLAHVGMVHRWAEHLVRVRATSRISPRDMGLSRGPVDATWLAEGLTSLLTTLRRSDPGEEMWAWGADQHVAFWARRQLHETLVHRLDLEGATGWRGEVGRGADPEVDSEVNPEVAADAIDEFLVNLGPAARFSPDLKKLVGTGEVLALVTDEGPRWSIRLDPEGFTILDHDAAASATLSGATAEMLRVLTRRRALEDSACVVRGARGLVQHWLAHSALQ